MTHVMLCVLIDHPDGHLVYTRDVDWSMPLPNAGERVDLVGGSVIEPVDHRVFVVQKQRVMLVFRVPAIDALTMPEALEGAGYSRGTVRVEASGTVRAEVVSTPEG